MNQSRGGGGLRPTFRMSTWVFSRQMLGPRLSASWSSSSLEVTSAETHRLERFASMMVSSFEASG